MSVCPWSGEIFQPTKKNQRFSSPMAKTAYHGAVRDLGQTIADTFPPGMLCLWVVGRISDPYTETPTSPSEKEN